MQFWSKIKDCLYCFCRPKSHPIWSLKILMPPICHVSQPEKVTFQVLVAWQCMMNGRIACLKPPKKNGLLDLSSMIRIWHSVTAKKVLWRLPDGSLTILPLKEGDFRVQRSMPNVIPSKVRYDILRKGGILGNKILRIVKKVVPGFRVLGFSALPGFRALKAGDGAWSVHKPLSQLFI